MKTIARRFGRSRDGNYALMTAAVMPLLLGAVGFSVDIATMSHSRAQLQDTLDAATLAASRLVDDSQSRQDVFDKYFAVNLAGAQDFRNVVTELTVDRGVNYIATTATARAEVVLNFPFLFGQTKYVSVAASAYESTNKLEVALVLDNTGSMGEARMAALRAAATALVDILQMVQGPQREVRAALVPFVTAVNVKGAGYKEDWIDTGARSSLHGANFDPVDGGKVNHLDLFGALDIDWKGCVEARPAPYNLSDEAPDADNPDTLFVPYFAPDEPGLAKYSSDSGDRFNNTYLDDPAATFVNPTAAMLRGEQRAVGKYSTATYSRVDGEGPATTGPNYACPTPIHPLTDDLAALKDEIARMIYWKGSGTNVAEGLAWGMRVLSPAEPYTQGAGFKTDGVSKIVVVFTDGENNVFGASNEAINKSDYGSYGFVDQGRMGSANRGAALTNVNTYTQQVCTALKQQEVQIFTVLLGADTAANRTLYSKCASTPTNYFATSDVSQLETTFRKIGAAVAGLYVTN